MQCISQHMRQRAKGRCPRHKRLGRQRAPTVQRAALVYSVLHYHRQQQGRVHEMKGQILHLRIATDAPQKTRRAVVHLG
jgi:hypothetical protein